MDVEDEVCGGTSPRVASEASDRDAEGGTMQLDVEGEDEEARFRMDTLFGWTRSWMRN